MKLAFTLFRYFPYGGLERDMLALAQLMHERGHEVTIYSRSWEGARPDLPVVLLPVRAMTNHGANAAFARRFLAELPADVDAVVGFNKMPGLDFYYAADVCFAEKAYAERSWLYRLTSRARSSLAMEAAVFGRDARTQILMISRTESLIYQKYYQTPQDRIHFVPPGINRSRGVPADYAKIRPELRQQYGLAPDDILLMMVGSDFRRKGFDRALRGIAALPQELRYRVRVWVAGQDKPQSLEGLAEQLGIADRLKVLGGRDDVAQLLWSADLLLHPARSEMAGLALLEAMIAGVPVIATEVCGYAHYITDHAMGEVIDAEAADATIAAAIQRTLQTPREEWIGRARHMIEHADIFSMTQRAAELIERGASRR
ncbi:MAG TPA: glycosyltransferase family 4 protein [Pseudomonas sp.]|uniref:glycosyltransferase family 4 protein n=1 Tax=Pseudomonas sp. TaxID=306 RepID=UPI002C605937|nr:glycosyltransferase family 4 protein [Pseudomonas sp.]HTO19109.1 glycosyltransferase family 4 protein [Pseudomonas sp.]